MKKFDKISLLQFNFKLIKKILSNLHIFFSKLDLLTRIRFLKFLKLSQNKKDLNDVTAVLFSVLSLLLAAEKKTPKTKEL